MPGKKRIEHQVSAGGVVYRTIEGHLQVVLCGRRSPLLWALPKGGPDAGESLDQTALREVQEETGLDAAIEAPVGKVDYWFVRSQDGVRCHKTVHYYLMAPTGGDFSRHDPEFDDVRWWPEGDALTNMTYPNEVIIVQKALKLARREHAPA